MLMRNEGGKEAGARTLIGLNVMDCLLEIKVRENGGGRESGREGRGGTGEGPGVGDWQRIEVGKEPGSKAES